MWSRGGEECSSTCGCQRLLGSLVTHRHQPAVEDSTPELPACLPLCKAQGLWNCASKGQTHGQHCHQKQQHQPAGSVSGHGCHVCRPYTKLHSPQWCAQIGVVQRCHSPKQERHSMSSAKPFPPKNHTQPSLQPTCNIITGRPSPFNSPQSPKPVAPYPIPCPSHLSAIVTVLHLTATTGLQWYAVSRFSPFPRTPSCPPPSSLPSPSPIALLPLVRPSTCSSAYIPPQSTATFPILAATATLLPIPSATPTACDAI